MKDEAEMSAPMLGSPAGLTVWCRVDFHECTVDELWIRVTIPVMLPVGATVGLPLPRSWDECTGIFSGTIDSIECFGATVCFDVEVRGIRMDEDGVQELIGIGYMNDVPGEVSDSWDSLLR